MHGTEAGAKHFFECPDDGHVYGIDVSFDDKGLTSVSFKCNSSEGLTVGGPFGKPGPKSEEHVCREGEHVSNFLGYFTKIITALDINCAKSGEPVQHFVKRNRTRKHSNTKSESEMDHTPCSIALVPKRRPVRFYIRTGEYVNFMGFIYKATGVAVDCRNTRLEIVRYNTFPEYMTYEIIGAVTGSSCSRSENQIYLSMLRTESNDTSDSNSYAANVNVGTNSVVPFEIGGFDFLSHYGLEDDLEFSFGVHSSAEVTSVMSKTTTNARTKLYRGQLSYQAPGAAVLVGYRTVYEIEKVDVDVMYHYRCFGGGSAAPTWGKIPMNKNLYGSVHFQGNTFRFAEEVNCTSKLQLCISQINLEGTGWRKPSLILTRMNTEVQRCLMGKTN